MHEQAARPSESRKRPLFLSKADISPINCGYGREERAGNLDRAAQIPTSVQIYTSNVAIDGFELMRQPRRLKL
jgi:hypothetical protein